MVRAGGLYHQFLEQGLVHGDQFEQADIGGVAKDHLRQGREAGNQDPCQHPAGESEENVGDHAEEGPLLI